MHLILFFIALVPALLFSQAPEFMQQYHQRLGGTTDELARVIRQFEEDSRRSGHDRQGALGLMEKNSERLVRDQAARMKENIARLARLREQQEAFRDGSAFVRVASLLTNADSDIFEATWQSYKPGLQITFDGILFALIGLLVPWGLMIAVVSAFGSRRRWV
jgi:thiosulfate reductase cytochrome b subunit